LENWLAATRELVGGAAQEPLTITGGSITPHNSSVILDTEGGAGSDDLDRIDLTHRPNGSWCFMRIETSAHKVRVRSSQGGDGQIVLHGVDEIFLDSSSMLLAVQRDNSQWVQRILEFGSNDGAFRSYHGLNDTATYPKASQAEAVALGSDVRLLTPVGLGHVLLNYGALISRAALRTSLASSADELLIGTSDGTNDIVGRISVANLFQRMFHLDFFSGELTCNPGDNGVVAHGLGGKPKMIIPTLICKTAQHGYSVGDEINIETVHVSGETRGLTYGANTNDIFWRIRSGFSLSIVSATTLQFVGITEANWRLQLRAWR